MLFGRVHAAEERRGLRAVKQRLDMFFMSGRQVLAFANAAKTMTGRIRELGPNPLKAQDEGGELRVKDEDQEEEMRFRGRR